jgi:putative tricarboxylic transport membrane protein
VSPRGPRAERARARGRRSPGERPPGLDTTEVRTIRDRRTAPPSSVASRSAEHPAVVSGAVTAVVGLLLVVAAIVVLTDAASLRPTTEPLGPAAFPTIIGILLALVGSGLVLVNLRFVVVLVRGGGGPISHRLWGVLGLLLGIVVYGLLLPFVGFTVVSVALFVAAALVLGSPRPWWRLALYGLVLAGLIVLLFDRVIGLALPAGPWGF